MTMSISLQTVVDWAANKYMDSTIPAQDRRALGDRILPIVRYNTMVGAFNASSAMLVVAAVAPIFFSFSFAVFVGAVAMLTRNVVQKDLQAMEDPLDNQQPVSSSIFNVLRGNREPNGAQNVL